MVRKAAWALAFALVPSLAAASPPAPTPSQIVALVKATPQLKIDPSVPPSPAFDPKSHPYVDVLGVPEGQAIGGYVTSELAHRGTLTSGYEVLAVPLDSGGSGGVFTQIVFARRGHVPFAYAGHIDSAGHLGGRLKAENSSRRRPTTRPRILIVAPQSLSLRPTRSATTNSAGARSE